MEASVLTGLYKLSAAMAISFGAFGSALGIGAAGPAAVGAWKKLLAQGKSAPFIFVIFIGAPLSQTIYGMLLMNFILRAGAAHPEYWVGYLGAGCFGGLAIGLPAWFQGIIGANAADAMGETGKGLGNYIMALGIIESVSIFVLVFIMAVLK
jgi:V/A-type H+/Na+-transporting ATPase subunit K